MDPATTELLVAGLGGLIATAAATLKCVRRTENDLFRREHRTPRWRVLLVEMTLAVVAAIAATVLTAHAS